MAKRRNRKTTQVKTVFFGKVQEAKQSHCPVCREKLDAITPTSSDTPSPGFIPDTGDFSVCIYCAAILRFRADRQLCMATAFDLMELCEKQPHTHSMLQRIAAAARMRVEMARRMQYRSN